MDQIQDVTRAFWALARVECIPPQAENGSSQELDLVHFGGLVIRFSFSQLCFCSQEISFAEERGGWVYVTQLTFALNSRIFLNLGIQPRAGLQV